MIFNQLRRFTADAMNATGMQAGMPKVRVYASEVQQLLERYDRLEAENARLREALSAVLDDLQLRADIRNGERVLDLSHGVLMKAEKALNPTSAGGLYDD